MGILKVSCIRGILEVSCGVDILRGRVVCVFCGSCSGRYFDVLCSGGYFRGVV